MFDAIADRYDFLNHLLSAGIDRRWRRLAVESLSLTGGERVLDVCTGTGDLAIAARTARPGAARRVIAVDFAPGMLRTGREKLVARRLTDSIALVRGDACRLPIADRAVEGVTIAFGIRNVEDAAAACAEIYRVLAPGGRIAILEFAVPSTPGIRAVYLWYFEHILPRIGRLVSKHTAAYEYLPASVRAFTAPDEFVKVLRLSGFVNLGATPLTCGIVFLYTGQRNQAL
jgi:demethylmenaquinone methyltransferase / 2-methoxy-6-polyprenyl-1,4-benzoquinol methylase